MSKSKFPGFKKCMEMMRKHNPGTREDGFHWLLPHAGEYLQELIEEFKHEDDPGLKCWLLELIGAAKAPEAFGLFVEYLTGEHEDLRVWAARGLKDLDTKEARTLLWQARSYTLGDEEETRRFREMIDRMREDN
jgi:hypothetical protein